MKYLARQGWEVGVVTPSPDLWGRIPNPGDAAANPKSVRFFYTAHTWAGLNSAYLTSGRHGLGRLFWGLCRLAARRLGIETEVGWAKSVRKILPELSDWRPDIILASGGPFVSHRLAEWLARQIQRPFVVDYRDGWSLNPVNESLRGKWNARTESRVLARSGALTCVTWTLGQEIAERFRCEKKLHMITNGYDPEEMAGVLPKEYDVPSMVYAGIFAPPFRSAELIMKTRHELKNGIGDKDWQFHYYGCHNKHVKDCASKFGVQDCVTLHGQVSREEALSAMSGATVSWVIASIQEGKMAGERGILTAKVFDAIGVGARILGIAPDNSDLAHLLSHIPHACCFRGSDSAGMARWLRKIRSMERTRSVPHPKYAWPNLVDALQIILKNSITACPQNEGQGGGLEPKDFT